MTLDEIIDRYDHDFLIADEKEMRIIYSVKKCINILNRDMTYEEAVEYFSFNVECAYMGVQTPIWCYD